MRHAQSCQREQVIDTALGPSSDGLKPAVRAALPPRLHRLRFHDLRHTAATLALAEGGDLAYVKERLSHENIATTVDLYGKRVASVDASIADAVGASIFEAPESDNVTPLRDNAAAAKVAPG